MDIILTVLVGGLIGYFTNWIAIRMLFRPYEEKVLFGRKLPFTPGMIPKERYRIAHSVGQTVEDYLLRPEKIMETILSKESEERISLYLKKRLNKLKNEELEVGNYLHGKGLDIERIKKFILPASEEFIVNYYNEEREKLRPLIEVTYDKLSLGLQDYIEENPYILNTYIEKNIDQINNFIIENLSSYKSDDRSLSYYIDEDRFIKIRDYILSNDIEIVEKIRLIYKERDKQDLLREFISNLVEKNVSRLITTIVGPDIIVDKILLAIDDYMYSNRIYIALEKIVILLEASMKDMKISSLASLLETYLKGGLLDRLLLEGKFIGEISNKVDLILKDKLIENKFKFVDYIDESIYSYINSFRGRRHIGRIVENAIFCFLSTDLSSLLDKLSSENIEEIVHCIFEFIRGIDDKIIVEVIKKLNISKLVEEEINSFPIDLGEEIILDIAGKELRAITNLGAFIGAFIGLLSYILQN